ncbi:MAG: DsbA family protein [Xanthomonadales bacterium]|nr:DsbA family protein [Xanthomonadales bacterium]
MAILDWYFDFISPFAYLQLAQLNRHREAGPNFPRICYRPVLLAGLLGHFGQKGPAEIPEKRRQTYRYCQWYAGRHGIPMRFPPAHPFNPLALLRLALAADCSDAAIQVLFDLVFLHGQDPNDPGILAEAGQQIGIADVSAAIQDPAIKTRLKDCTDQAIQRGVFGVPMLGLPDGEIFWGLDSTEMALDGLADPGLFQRDPYDRLAALPQAASRI